MTTNYGHFVYRLYTVFSSTAYILPQDEDNLGAYNQIFIRDQVKISWCKEKNASGFTWDPVSYLKQLS